MRTLVACGIATLCAVLTLACSNEPVPQAPASSPKPQSATLGTPSSPGALTQPKPQQPAMGEPSRQEAASRTTPQKPFYGPGLAEPDQRATERAKAKQPLRSDAEVLAFALGRSEGELQLADLAKRKAESKEVKELAATIARQSESEMKKIRDVQGREKLQLEANDLSKEMQGELSDDMARLRKESGKDFDRIYVNTEVRLNMQALDRLQSRVVPGAASGDVKTTVTKMQSETAHRLEKAQALLEKLDPTAAAALKDSVDQTLERVNVK